MKRRTFIKWLGAGGVGTGATLVGYWPDEGVFHPCRPEETPKSLLFHDVVLSAWDGLDPEKVWDCHTHLVGVGHNASGIWINPDMQSPFSPLQYIRYLFYLNAACIKTGEGIDRFYVDQLKRRLLDYPLGSKLMLLAFDYRHDEQGRRDRANAPFYVPNDYAARIAHAAPQYFEWIASIHPYRADAVEALQLAVKHGARAIKWLPPVMNIDPASPKCDAFYKALAELNLSLLSHAGDEHAVAGVESQTLGNPLRLRRALQHGVRVIVAHCASMGYGHDLDKGPAGPGVSNFDLFARLMDEPRYEGLLFGDISALTQLNRLDRPLQVVLQRDDWHHRLLNGSDFPLPGVMPLFSTSYMVEQGYINERIARVLRELRQYNPILYDFVLKRHLRYRGKAFSDSVFETRRFFIEE